MTELEAQLQAELNQVIDVLEKELGLRSRWTGIVYLTDDVSARGRMNWAGDIFIDSGLARTDLRWRTLIHEALHTLSAGLKPTSYSEVRGWEEGVVEKLQRLLRPTVQHALSLSVPEVVFEEIEQGHRFNVYIEALEEMRGLLNVADMDFYPQLLATPLQERSGYAIHLAQKLGRTGHSDFLRRFGVWSGVLKGRYGV